VSGSPAWELHKALHTRLSGDTTLTTTLGASVYDHVSPGTAYPYVTIGEATEAPNDTMGQTGRDVTITVHYWSQLKGVEQVYKIHDRVDELLNDWMPTGLTGWTSVVMRFEFFDSFRGPDGATRHGVARYRAEHVHE
jgi:hypothetical protein